MSGVDAGPHRGARRRAYGHGAVLSIEAHAARLETLHRRESHRIGDLHMGVPLVHAKDQEVGLGFQDYLLSARRRLRSQAATGKRMANPTKEETITMTTVSGSPTA